MMGLLQRIGIAVVVGVLVYLACIFIGGVILVGLGVPIASDVGAFLAQYAVVFGFLAFLWQFFRGGPIAI